MIRPGILSVLASLPFLMAPFSAAPAPALAPPCAELWARDPLVVYSLTQGTLVAPIDEVLLVDSAGTARLVRSTANGDGSKAAVVSIGADAALQLQLALAGAGAGVVCDGGPAPIPTPLKSLTILRPGTDARAHNASWLVAQPEHAAIQTILDDFIAATFPGF